MKKNKRGRLLIVIGAVLIFAAAALSGYNIIISEVAERNAKKVLDELTLLEEDREEKDTPEYLIDSDVQMPVITIDGYDYIGRIDIPSLQLSLPVMSEWDYPRLKISPCRFRGSVYQNNMIICAHNYNRHFGQIKTLGIGDEVYFTDVDGNVFSYNVVDMETIQPTAIEEMTSGDWDLTLFTCTIGGASRVTVRCERMEN